MRGQPDLRARRFVGLLVLLGAVLLATGLGYGSPLQTAVFVGAMMLVWTTLLPRLSTLQSLDVFVASHALAAGAFWGALSAAEDRVMLVGNPWVQARELRWWFLAALTAGALGLLIGWRIDRAVRRHEAWVRRALAAAVALASGLAIVLVGLALGDAPLPIERLREAPIVAEIASSERLVPRGPLPLVRSADGVFAPLTPAELERVASDPQLGADWRAIARLVRDPDPRLCTRLRRDTAPIEVRQVAGLVLYTQAGGLDDPYAQLVTGCAYDPATLRRVPITASMLEHPLAGSDRTASIAFGALAVALLSLVLAGVALRRHARLRVAREGVSDGAGVVTFADGTTARVRTSAGPVLALVRPITRGSYRESAMPEASVLARGTLDDAEAAMHHATCRALTTALGASCATALPFGMLVAQGYVVRF